MTKPAEVASVEAACGKLSSGGKWFLSCRQAQNVLLTFLSPLRLFGGLIFDIKRKAPHYLSDYTDALSLQCLASFLFLYCACMSPVITFGGLLGEATEGRVVRGFKKKKNTPVTPVYCGF